VKKPKKPAYQHGGSKSKDFTKEKTVKYLGVCRDAKAYNAVIKSAPDSVVRSICDAAANVQRGAGVNLTNRQQVLFRQHGSSINKLVSKTFPLSSKRRLLSQRGGAFWIPALIGAAVSALGSSLFGGTRAAPQS
jgi:hypothetical protein